MKLHWVNTKQGVEDWFIVANSEEEAAECHEDFEGFAKNTAIAKFVCDIPDNLMVKYNLIEPQWPSHELISDLGGNIISEYNPRKVNFNGVIFTEGGVTEPIFLNQIRTEKGVYVIKMQNTEKYKIGKTIDLKRRLKQFSTGNPENIKITYFIATEHYKSLEKHLHEVFKGSRISGEWFSFNEEKLQELESHLSLLQSDQTNAFKVYNLKHVSMIAGVY